MAKRRSKVKTVKTDSLSAFVKKVEELTSDDCGPCWYRGIGKASYTLTPSLFRHPSNLDEEGTLEMENNVIRRFVERSLPYLAQKRFDSDLERLFFMQHHGIPTRLLDWSENPFVGLFFALEENYKEDAVVWFLRPKNWNIQALKHLSVSDFPISHDDEVVKNGYKPGRVTHAHPLAISGLHNSDRIVAQRGVFMLFGRTVKSMEDTYEENPGFQDDTLLRVKIPKANREKMLKDLISIGITDATIYPDLAGLAQETKRYFRFI